MEKSRNFEIVYLARTNICKHFTADHARHFETGAGRFVNGSLLPARAKAWHVNPTRVKNEHLKVFPWSSKSNKVT